jgi:hypothetical protein
MREKGKEIMKRIIKLSLNLTLTSTTNLLLYLAFLKTKQKKGERKDRG